MSLYGTPPEDPTPSPSTHPDAVVPVLPKCTACGGHDVEQGFIEDNGEGSQGFARWIPGALERGIFGGARRMGRQRFEILTLRCTACQHLDLYVGNPV